MSSVLKKTDKLNLSLSLLGIKPLTEPMLNLVRHQAITWTNADFDFEQLE